MNVESPIELTFGRFIDVNAVQLLNISLVSAYMFWKSAETSPLSLKALFPIKLRLGISIVLNASQWLNTSRAIDETPGMFTHVRLIQSWNKVASKLVILGRSIEIRFVQQRNAEYQVLCSPLPYPVML